MYFPFSDHRGTVADLPKTGNLSFMSILCPILPFALASIFTANALVLDANYRYRRWKLVTEDEMVRALFAKMSLGISFIAFWQGRHCM